MIYIQKGKEPGKLTQYRKLEGATYKDMETETKNEVRDNLLKEQGYLCCYCMRRISSENTKIEHYKSQSVYPQFQLRYNNLLAACKGHEGEKEEHQTCDTKKGNDEISISPLDKQAMQTIYYTGDGKIHSKNYSYNEDIDKRLNLNNDSIVKARNEAISVTIQYINTCCDGMWSKSKIQTFIDKWSSKNSNGEFEVCYGAVLYFLEKRKSRC